MNVTIKGTTMSIGERVLDLRKRRTWHRSDLAERARERGHDVLALNDLALIEEGLRQPTAVELKAIAAAFGMSFARLLGFKTQAELDADRDSSTPVVEPAETAAPAQLTLVDATINDLTKRLDKANAWADRVLDLLGVDRGLVEATEFALGRLANIKEDRERVERMLSQSHAAGDRLRAELDKATAILAPLDTIARRHGWNGCAESETPKAFAEFFDGKLKELEHLKANNRYHAGHTAGMLEGERRGVRKAAEEIASLKTAWRDAIGGLKVAARSEIEALTLTTRKLVTERDAARAELDRIQNPRERALSSCEQAHKETRGHILTIFSRLVDVETSLLLLDASTRSRK